MLPPDTKQVWNFLPGCGNTASPCATIVRRSRRQAFPPNATPVSAGCAAVCRRRTMKVMPICSPTRRP